MSEQPTGRHRGVADLTAIVHELIAPSRHRQPYRAGWQRPNRTGAVIRNHVTDHPSLIAQLREAITDRAESGAGMKAGQAPRTTLPRFDVDSFDRMERIRFEVTQWCEHVDIPSQSARYARLIVAYLDVIERAVGDARVASADTDRAIGHLRAVATFVATAVEPDISRLVERVQDLGPEAVDVLTADAERWRTWCRIMAGWQDPALRPHVPCPDCGALAGERAGLRIRIEAAGGTGGIKGDATARAAVCLSCNRTWDAEHFGLLAERLREAEAARENAEGQVWS
jgi:hypothetical protein